MVLVVYESKYGYTLRYANWLCEELNCLGIEACCLNEEYLSQPDVIVFLGGIYAGGISGIKIFKKFYKLMACKKIVFATVGLSSYSDESQYKSMLNKNFTQDMIDNVRFFHFCGGINYQKLSFVHSVMMKMFYFMVKKKKNKTPEDEQMLKTYGKQVDLTDKNSLKQMVTYIKSLEGKEADSISS